MNARWSLYACACAFGIVLPGCAATTTYHAYEGPVRKDSEVATVEALSSFELRTYIRAVDRRETYKKEDEGLSRIERGSVNPEQYATTVKLLPGYHLLSVYCVKETYKLALTHASGDFMAGRHYFVKCVDEGDKARAELASWPPPLEVDPATDVVWNAWVDAHGSNACHSARTLLMSDADCAGQTCAAVLEFSYWYRKQCSLDTDGRIELQRMRNRWRKEAGETPSQCLTEISRPPGDPAMEAAPPPNCEGKTETALREVMQRRSKLHPDR
jgi:hypothetical protein